MKRKPNVENGNLKAHKKNNITLKLDSTTFDLDQEHFHPITKSKIGEGKLKEIQSLQGDFPLSKL